MSYYGLLDESPAEDVSTNSRGQNSNNCYISWKMLSSVRFQDIRRGRYAEKAQVVLVMGNIRFEWSVVCCFWSYLSSTNIEEVKRLIGHLWT